jgi:hypothetical protein
MLRQQTECCLCAYSASVKRLTENTKRLTKTQNTIQIACQLADAAVMPWAITARRLSANDRLPRSRRARDSARTRSNLLEGPGPCPVIFLLDGEQQPVTPAIVLQGQRREPQYGIAGDFLCSAFRPVRADIGSSRLRYPAAAECGEHRICTPVSTETEKACGPPVAPAPWYFLRRLSRRCESSAGKLARPHPRCFAYPAGSSIPTSRAARVARGQLV